MLDFELAQVYGVTTKRFNEAFKRNSRRFPVDFSFRLTETEFANLKSKIATSSAGGQESDTANWSQIATGSQKHRPTRYLPWAFTEHGAIMVANILRSVKAVQMSVYVVRAFIRLREHIAANQSILRRLAEIDKILFEHDSDLRDVYEKLLPLLEPPSDDPPKRRIGFQKST